MRAYIALIPILLLPSAHAADPECVALLHGLWRTEGAMPGLARNADGDEVLFVHEGSGHLFCDYGHLEIRDGDYVVLPRGTMWRTEFDGRADLLLIEAGPNFEERWSQSGEFYLVAPLERERR